MARFLSPSDEAVRLSRELRLEPDEDFSDFMSRTTEEERALVRKDRSTGHAGAPQSLTCPLGALR